MPLQPGKSPEVVSSNIREMVHAGHKRSQAVAAALHNARKYAAGGPPPLGERYAQRQLMSQGFLHSAVPGRTDKLPITVGGGAYVLPADHLAAIGQGNSIAGANIVNKMFKMGPYGTQAGGIHGARAPVPHVSTRAPMPQKPQFAKFARGGHGKPVDIVAAGGEMVIPPEKIIEKFGSLKHGHKILDEWVKSTRKRHIKTLRKLKPPKVN